MSKFFDDTMQGLLEAVEIKDKSMPKEEKGINDCLYIGVDFAPNDTDMIMVMRRKGEETHIINLLKDEEAREVYNKLIGKPYSICDKCKYYECAWKGDNVKSCKYFKKGK